MMENKQFLYPLVIREFRLDTFGHLNNAEYLRIFEEARWEWITSQGLGRDEIRKLGVGPVMLEIKIKFKREVHLREKVTIESRCLKYHGKMGVLSQQMVNESGVVMCEAEFTFGLMDMTTRKLVTPSERWLTAFGMSKV